MSKIYSNLYKQDGTIISTDGTQTNPLEAILVATNNEEKILETTLKAVEGFKLAGGTTIKVGSGTDSDWIESGRFFVSLSAEGEWTKAITIDSEVDAGTGVKVYFKAVSNESEDPAKDTSTVIKVQSLVLPV